MVYPPFDSFPASGLSLTNVKTRHAVRKSDEHQIEQQLYDTVSPHATSSRLFHHLRRSAHA
jgi:hypothetical protein